MDDSMKTKRGRGRNYMMRSEKRRGYGSMPPQEPKKRNWYQVLTVIMLIVCCPVGLIMLWRKRLNWKGWIKLIATLLSIMMLFLELGAALWYPFEDERIKNIQNKASAVIEQAAEASGELIRTAADKASENWNAFWSNKREIGAAAGNHALGLLLDAIASPSPEPTQVPPMTLTQGQGSSDIPQLLNEPTATPEPTAEPTPTPTAEPTPTPTAEPTPTPTAEPTPAPTAEPTEEPDASANVLQRPTPSASMLPTFDPLASATPVPPVTPTPTPTATPLPTEAPTATPVPTPEPTIDPASIPKLQSPGEMTVWHTSDGKYYHKASVCGSMSNAREHTLSSAISAGKKACPYCSPFEEKWAREKAPTVFVGSDNYWHIRTGCESCTDTYTPMLLDEVRTSYRYAPCDACGSRYYVNGMPSLNATATPVPGTAATDAPVSAETVPQAKKAGDVLVWHTSNGKWYHKASVCGSMSNASQYTLSSAVSKGKTACPYCNPIDESWAAIEDEAAFVSAKNVWHLDESCRSNTGDYTVMTLTAARADSSLAACTACGANRYTGSSAAKTSPTEEPQIGDAPAEDGLNLGSVVNGDVLVYYSGNTSHYHRRNRCSSSTTTVFQPHTLMEALIEEKIACPLCNPPAPETN